LAGRLPFFWLSGARVSQRQEDASIDHTEIGVAHVSRSARFDDAALTALGLRRVAQMPEGVGSEGVGYGVECIVFWIDQCHPRSAKYHIAFATKSRAEVNAFYGAYSRRAEQTMAGPGYATPQRAFRRDTMPPSCSTRTAIMSRPCFGTGRVLIEKSAPSAPFDFQRHDRRTGRYRYETASAVP